MMGPAGPSREWVCSRDSILFPLVSPFRSHLTAPSAQALRKLLTLGKNRGNGRIWPRKRTCQAFF
jgi:hypothetical protein